MLVHLSFRRIFGFIAGRSDCCICINVDANTDWKYEELLAQKNLTDGLFCSLLSQMEAHGFRPQGGQIVDATLVEAPKRKTEEQHEEKARKAQEKLDGDDDDPTPPPSERTPAQQRQASRDAAWTEKHGKSYFGYKNHTSVDKKHKIIRSYKGTAANVYDGHQLEALADGDNSVRMSGQTARIEAKKMRGCWKSEAIALTSTARNHEARTCLKGASKRIKNALRFGPASNMCMQT